MIKLLCSANLPLQWNPHYVSWKIKYCTINKTYIQNLLYSVVSKLCVLGNFCILKMEVVLWNSLVWRDFKTSFCLLSVLPLDQVMGLSSCGRLLTSPVLRYRMEWSPWLLYCVDIWRAYKFSTEGHLCHQRNATGIKVKIIEIKLFGCLVANNYKNFL